MFRKPKQIRNIFHPDSYSYADLGDLLDEDLDDEIIARDMKVDVRFVKEIRYEEGNQEFNGPTLLFKR